MSDRGPHSRACGVRPHDHGRHCHSNCPTCGGRAPAPSTPPTQPDRDTLVAALITAEIPYYAAEVAADAVLALLAAGTPTATADALVEAPDSEPYSQGWTTAPPPAEDTDTLRATLAGVCDLYPGSADVPRFSVSDVRAWLNWSPPVRDEAATEDGR